MFENQRFHPVNETNSGIINTLHGKFNFLNPSEDAIYIQDIACSLSKICRFTGHLPAFYSVAQHSVLVAAMAPEWCRKEALLHDAAEAYVGDIHKPLKNLLGPSFANIEYNLETVIAQKFGLKTDAETRHEVKKWDHFAIQLEFEAFYLDKPGRLLNMLHYHQLIVDAEHFTWNHEVARKCFFNTYQDLFVQATAEETDRRTYHQVWEDFKGDIHHNLVDATTADEAEDQLEIQHSVKLLHRNERLRCLHSAQEKKEILQELGTPATII